MTNNKNNKNETEVFDLPKNPKRNMDDCEKVRFMADEYLHDVLLGFDGTDIPRKPELSEEDRDFIEKHMAECRECMELIEAESKYLEEVRLAEYIPEISVSGSVTDKIIENKMIIDKPPKRRKIPIGFISAAAVVAIMFLMSKGGPLSVLLRQEPVRSANDSAEIAEYAEYDGENGESGMFQFGTLEDGIFNDADQAEPEAYALGADFVLDDNYDMGMGIEPEENLSPAPAAAPAPAPRAVGGDVDDHSETAQNAQPMAESVMEIEAEEPPAAEIPEAVNESGFESMEEYLILHSGLEISQFYEIYFLGIGAIGKKSDIFKNIAVYRVDPNETKMFDIIDKRYKDTINKNLTENNIYVGEILSKYPDGDYIAVIYWSN